MKMRSIHVHTLRKITGNSEGGVGLKSPKTCKENCEAKLEFQKGWGV